MRSHYVTVMNRLYLSDLGPTQRSVICIMIGHMSTC